MNNGTQLNQYGGEGKFQAPEDASLQGIERNIQSWESKGTCSMRPTQNIRPEN